MESVQIIRLGFALLILGETLMSACGKEKDKMVPPISFPFSTWNPGDIEEYTFKVPERHTYTFQIEYKYADANERARVWMLAGGDRRDESGKWIEPGADLHLEIKLVSILNGNKYEKYSETISNPPLASWGEFVLDAKLFNATLEPGHYRVIMKNLKDATKYKSVKLKFGITKAHVGK